MIFQAHLAYPFLLLFMFDKGFGLNLGPVHYFILLFFSILPDLDYLAYFAVKRRINFNNVRHHEWPTHWPITYSPLLLALLVYPSTKLAIVVFALYMHMAMDLFFVGDGIMILYPFSKKYYNHFSKKTQGYHGREWIRITKQTVRYKIDNISLVISLILFAVYIM